MLLAEVGTRSTASNPPPRHIEPLAQHNPPRARNRTNPRPMCAYVHHRAVPCILVQRKKLPEKCCTNHTELHIPSVFSAASAVIRLFRSASTVRPGQSYSDLFRLKYLYELPSNSSFCSL